MRELDERIAVWRRGMQLDAEALDELEAHVRDDVERLVGGGMTEAAAFDVAVTTLGRKEAIVAEYAKVERTPVVVKIAGIAWILIVIAGAALLLRGLMSGRLTGLLFAHIVTVLGGYLGGFVLGAFGISMAYSVQKHTLRRMIVALTPVVAALIAIALVLGMFWMQKTHGRLVNFAPREVCAMLAVAWFVAVICVHGLRQPRDETVARLAMCGGVVVMLAWFGAGLAPAVPPLLRVVAVVGVFIVLPLWMIFAKRKDRATPSTR